MAGISGEVKASYGIVNIANDLIFIYTLRVKIKVLIKSPLFYYLIFAFLVFLAFYIRLNRFSTNIVWCADIARDFLAGELIANRGQIPTEGHWNSGINYVYPSIYYYLIAVLTRYFSIYGISIIFIFFHVLAIASFSLVLKNTFSKRVSLLTLFSLSLSPLMIYLSRITVTAFVSMIFFLFSLTFLLLYLQKKNFFALFLSALFLAINTAIFYGALMFLPFYILLLVFAAPYKAKVDRYLVAINFFTLFFCFYWLFFWPILDNEEALNLFFLGKRKAFIFSNDLFFEKINKRLREIFIFAAFPAIVSTCLIAIMAYKKRLIAFLTIGLILALLCFGLFNGNLGHYLVLATPLYYVLFVLLVDYLIEKKHLKVLIVYILLMIFATQLLQPYEFSDRHPWPRIQSYQRFAEYLIKNYDFENVYMTELTVPVQYGNYDSRNLWYMLQDRMDFTFDNAQIDLIVNSNNPGENLFVCKEFAYQLGNTCQEVYDHPEMQQIDYVEYEDMVFTVYRY